MKVRIISVAMGLSLAAGLYLIPATTSGGIIDVANFSGGTIGEYTTSGATVKAALVSGLNNAEGIVVSESVPDGGTTAMLLGSALSGIGLARRFLRR